MILGMLLLPVWFGCLGSAPLYKRELRTGARILPKPWMCIFVAAVLPHSPLVAQASLFPSPSPLADAETHGQTFPVLEEVPQLPRAFLSGEIELEGSPQRTCSEVWIRRGEEPIRMTVNVRSGEMIIGGTMGIGTSRGRMKLYWKPLQSSERMTLSVIGQRVGSTDEIIQYTSRPTMSNAPGHQRPDDLFFPGVIEFSSPGKWVVVGTSGSQWGCFVFDVPAWDSPPT
jgi:hypothetical protein